MLKKREVGTEWALKLLKKALWAPRSTHSSLGTRFIGTRFGSVSV